MERILADVKVLWSNLYRNVRSLYIAFVKPRDTYVGYRLLATMSKFRDEFKDVDDLKYRFLLRIKVKSKIKDGDLAFIPMILSTNLIAKVVSKNPDYSVAVVTVKGFKNPKLIAASVTFSKGAEWLSAGVRPIIITFNPDVNTKSLKRLSGKLAKVLWDEIKSRINYSGIRYAGIIESMRLYPVLSVIALNSRAYGVEEIKAVISDGSEYKEVKIPVRLPEWRLDDLPDRVIEDVKVVIINPIRKGLPFAAKGAFITGPPGVGKSVMAEALADALGLKIVELRPQTYRSMWYGATEKMLNAIFQQVIRRRKEIALVIDDAEFISSRKYTIHEAHISEISTVLYHLQRPDRPFTILTANNPDLIDPAILRPGRIDVMIVLGYPDRRMRRKAVLKHVNRYKIKVSDELIDEIVDITKWYSLAEVEAFIRLAAGKGDGKITENEIKWTKKKFNISPTERASIQEYLRWWASKVQGVVITYIPNENEI